MEKLVILCDGFVFCYFDESDFWIQEFSGGVFRLILSADKSELTLSFIIYTPFFSFIL